MRSSGVCLGEMLTTEEEEDNCKHSTEGNYFQSYAHDPYLRGSVESYITFANSSLTGWLSLRINKGIVLFRSILKG